MKKDENGTVQAFGIHLYKTECKVYLAPTVDTV